MKCKFLKLLFYHKYAWQEKVGNADIAAFTTIGWIGFVATIDFVAPLRRMFPPLWRTRDPTLLDNLQN